MIKIMKSKNQIAFITGGLIILSFINHWFIHIPNISEIGLLIATIIGVLPIAIQAYQSLKLKLVSIDVLLTLAVIGALIIQNYEESAIVTFLFLFGSFLEQRTLKQTRSAIKELVEMAPENALLLNDEGEFEEVDIDFVDIDDVLLVKTGAKVPVDGEVIEGEAHIDEASITGEAVPVKKEISSKVFAGTIVENGTIRIRAEKVGEDTTFGKIIELVEEAQDSKSEAERFIDKFFKYYTPAVLVLAILVWIFTRNIELSITIMVLGCPGALVIGVPVSNVAGIGNGAKNGILLKGSEVIHDFSQVDTIIFDKTGTLTIGHPKLDKSVFYEGEGEVIKYLVSVEKESNHPLANALLKEYGDVKTIKVDKTKVIKGGGIIAEVDGKKVQVGNEFLMNQESIIISNEQKSKIDDFSKSGSSIVIIAIDGVVSGIFGIRDQVRPGAFDKLRKLKDLGVKNLIILSGDNQATVDIVADELGFTEAHGDLLPEDKSKFVRKLVDKGQKVAFVGDGINDSPSLALADVGIAMGSGTDVAIETSELVLMNSDIGKLPFAFGLVKKTAANMKQNIIIAVGVVLFLLTSLISSGWMNMTLGMLIHEGSIIVVILNGMRLINYKLKEE